VFGDAKFKDSIEGHYSDVKEIIAFSHETDFSARLIQRSLKVAF